MNVNALTVDMGGNTDTENVVTVEEAAVAENICTVGQNILRYTCGSYNVSTTSKAEMDNHVNTEHKPFVNEEVIFSCKKCKHDFKEEDNYINHMKNHEISSKRDVSKPRNSVEFMVKDYSEVENAVFCHILESLCLDPGILPHGGDTSMNENRYVHLGSTTSTKPVFDKMVDLTCRKCEF